MIETVLVAFVALAAALLLLSRRVRTSSSWRATVTPLASIIGSGFLVSAPLLAREVGNWAILAMLGLIVVSFVIGEAIRFNIAHVEPLLNDTRLTGQDRLVIRLERLSHYLLAFAYFVSVAYYLVLLGNFLLKGMGIVDEAVAELIATGLLLIIAVVGGLRGLGLVESVEEYTVGINLAAITSLLAGLLLFNASSLLAGDWQLTATTAAMDGDSVRVVLGLLIVVQGFETSRFMEDEFDAATRIRTMRHAQLIAAAFYLTFFSLITVLFGELGSADGVAAIVGLVGHVAVILPLIIVLSAVASQFSASVADSVGGAGLIREISRGRLKTKMSYPLIASVSIGIIWVTDIFRLVTLASQAFALFYCVQCAVALARLWGMTEIRGRGWRALLFLLGGLLSGSVVLFGIPSGG